MTAKDVKDLDATKEGYTLTIGIYHNKQWKYNVVRNVDLQSHIEYNLTLRPGRIFYVNGVRKNNGMLSKDKLPEYDALEKEIRTVLLKDVNLRKDTRPYV